jgi:hypothetical protein
VTPFRKENVTRVYALPYYQIILFP